MARHGVTERSRGLWVTFHVINHSDDIAKPIRWRTGYYFIDSFQQFSISHLSSHVESSL
ncbi:hypothetical protein D3C73_1574880 [compost metagenome]